jgi:branched-chain amino acid transport system ATP-binding protein
MLQVSHVVAGYGAIDCLHGVSLEVHPGEIVALLGANGAGKTTTLMAISGLLPCRAGRITFDGMDLPDESPESLVRRGLSHVPEGRRILGRLTVEENLRLGAYTRADAVQVHQDLQRAYALFPILASRRRQLAGTLSGGEQQMLAIARGLMSRPKLLLLDEPSLGLAPKMIQLMFETIQRLNREGLTILLVEQNAYQALHVAHRGYVLETGRVVLEDTAAHLTTNPRITAAYLGS